MLNFTMEMLKNLKARSKTVHVIVSLFQYALLAAVSFAVVYVQHLGYNDMTPAWIAWFVLDYETLEWLFFIYLHPAIFVAAGCVTAVVGGVLTRAYDWLAALVYGGTFATAVAFKEFAGVSAGVGYFFIILTTILFFALYILEFIFKLEKKYKRQL